MERVSVPETILRYCPENMKANLGPASYFGYRPVIFQEGSAGMQAWRKQLFRFMYRNSQQPSDYLSVPTADSMAVSIRITF